MGGIRLTLRRGPRSVAAGLVLDTPPTLSLGSTCRRRSLRVPVTWAQRLSKSPARGRFLRAKQTPSLSHHPRSGPRPTRLPSNHRKPPPHSRIAEPPDHRTIEPSNLPATELLDDLPTQHPGHSTTPLVKYRITELSNCSTTELLKCATTQTLNCWTTELLNCSTARLLDYRTPQLQEHPTTEPLKSSAAQPLGHSASQARGHSATQPLGRSATPPSKH